MVTRDRASRHRGAPLRRQRWPGLLLICLTYLALTTAWNLILPPYENLDEVEHAEVVRHLVVTGRLPVHGEAEAEGFRVRQEASQPPLYYLLAAGWSRLLSLPTTPHDPEPKPIGAVACGSGPTFYNKMTWVHAPDEARLPWDGALRTVHLLRLFSSLLQLGTVVGAWVLASRIAPRGPLAPLVAGFVAFNPQFMMVAAGVNNDNAVVPLATWGLVLALDLWRCEPRPTRVVSLGVLGGLAALSKLSGFGLIGLGGLVLLIEGIQHRRPIWRIALNGLLLTLPAALLVAPWMLRNLRLYGDPTALSPMLGLVGQRAVGISPGEIWLMVRSYWGQLPCAFYPRALYWPYLLFILGGLAGLTAGWRHLTMTHRQAIVLSAIWFAVIVGAWLRWNRMTFATGGRLLFPATAAAALILGAGWQALGRRSLRLCSAALNNCSAALRHCSAALNNCSAALPLLSLATLVLGVIPMAIPPRVDPVEAVGQGARIVSFDGRIVLTDYEAHITRPRWACALVDPAYCGEALDLALTWEAVVPPEENWLMVIQLVSPVPGETDLRLNYGGWPGRGQLPTSKWQAGTRFTDRYLIPLPNQEGPTRAWQVLVAFVEPETEGRVPVTLDGEPAGDAARLALLRVPGDDPVPEAWEGELPRVDFGGAIRLAGSEVERAAEDGAWQVRLLWESLASVEEDYVIFVHAYDAAGELLATGDGPPLGGGFPTSLWAPGDRVVTTHTLEVGTASPATVKVGLYRRADGVRLPAEADGQRLLDDAAVIWARDNHPNLTHLGCLPSESGAGEAESAARTEPRSLCTPISMTVPTPAGM